MSQSTEPNSGKPSKPPQPTPRMYTVEDMVPTLFEEAVALWKAKKSGIPRGPITTLPLLDEMLSGCLMPGLHFLDGAPGTGKSALMLQIAATCGFPALYVTCEMPPLELTRRIAARVCGVSLTNFKTGEMKPSDAQAMGKRAAAVTKQLVLVDSTIAPSLPVYLRECMEVLKVHHDSLHALVVIDSLHSWARGYAAANGINGSEYDVLNGGIHALKLLASELNNPIFCISERNRGAMDTGGLSAGAGTRLIEYSAETMLGLEKVSKRREENRPDFAGNVPLKLWVNKNRHGAHDCCIDLKFNGRFQSFVEDSNESYQGV